MTWLVGKVQVSRAAAQPIAGKPCAVPVGGGLPAMGREAALTCMTHWHAELPANTGKSGAMYRVVFFAGMPHTKAASRL